MFLKTTNPTFLNFGDIVSSDIDFSCSNEINLTSKSIDELKLVCDDCTFVKVIKGLVMILVSLDGNNIKSFIVNKNLHIKKVPILILGYVSPLRDKYDIKTTTP